MIPREIAATIVTEARGYPVIGVLGPRQSGKTTLVRALFPQHHYANLEDPSQREFARIDPKGFLSSSKLPLIIDEFQRVPELLSSIQVDVDQSNEPGRFILTGSQSFLMMEQISQSLAGRITIHFLLPLSLSELASSPSASPPLYEAIHRGFFPRLDRKSTRLNSSHYS